MKNWAAGSLILNIILALVLFMAALSWPGSKFLPPWDGPTVATLVLSAATVVLAGVAVIAGVAAIWGIATLREHAGNIAESVANEAADKAASRKVEELAKQWTLTSPAPSEGVADAYKDGANV